MLKDIIRQKREERKVTQNDLAEQLHVIRQTISKWERGLSVPDAEQLMAMAKYFSCTTDELLGYTHEEMVQKTEIRQQLQEEAGKLVIPKRELLVTLGLLLLGIIVGGMLGSYLYTSDLLHYGSHVTHAIGFMDLLKSLFVNPYVIVIGIVLCVYSILMLQKYRLNYMRKRIAKSWWEVLIVVCIGIQFVLLGYYRVEFRPFVMVFMPVMVMVVVSIALPLGYLTVLLRDHWPVVDSGRLIVCGVILVGLLVVRLSIVSIAQQKQVDERMFQSVAEVMAEVEKNPDRYRESDSLETFYVKGVMREVLPSGVFVLESGGKQMTCSLVENGDHLDGFFEKYQSGSTVRVNGFVVVGSESVKNSMFMVYSVIDQTEQEFSFSDSRIKRAIVQKCIVT